MNTGLKDKNGTPIEIGSRTRLVLASGEVREFDVQFKTVTRTVKNHPDFEGETSKVNITGVAFCWEGYDLFPCIDENGVSDTEKMEVIQQPGVETINNDAYMNSCCCPVCKKKHSRSSNERIFYCSECGTRLHQRSFTEKEIADAKFEREMDCYEDL